MRTLCDAYYEEHDFHYRAFLDISGVVSQEKQILTTVPERAHRRLLQLIHVKRSTVLHFNVVLPPTAVAGPMITNLTSHFTVCDRRMLSFEPSWCMRTTTTDTWTLSGHLGVTRDTSKAIPARGKISSITSYWDLTSESDKAVACSEIVVVDAWVLRCCNLMQKQLCFRFENSSLAKCHTAAYREMCRKICFRQ